MSQQIYQLIPKVMADVGAIEKGRRNEAQKFFFRGIDDVMGAFQPVLAKHQIFYVPEVIDKGIEERQTKSGTTMIYTTLTVAYTFFAPDGSSVRAVVVGEAMDSGDKSSNKAMSAALKYCLLQVFCVPTEANEDADAESPEVTRRDSAPAKPRLAAAPAQPAPAKPEPKGRRKLLKEICDELIQKGIKAGEIKEQIKMLCDGATDTTKLTDGDVEGLIEEFGRWLDKLAA
jgi:hypothetical protein